MQVNVQRLSPVLVELEVQVGADRVRAEVDKAYGSLSKNARVRGFRPGKAPRGVLVHLYGGRVAADVAKRIIDETFPDAVKGQGLTPISNTDFGHPPRIADNQPFNYKARFEVLPVIERVEYEGLSAKKRKVEVSDEAVAAELDKLRQVMSTLEPLDQARPTEKGDVLIIDYTVQVRGKVIQDAGAVNLEADLGSGSLLPAIEEALLGHNAGDQVEVEVAMPAHHPQPALRGQRAKLTVKVREIKKRVLPAVDDELAHDAGNYANLEELRADLRAKLQKSMEEEVANALAQQLVVELVKANPITVPSVLVEQQNRVTEQELLAQARRQGQSGNLSPETLAHIRADSELKVRAGLLMAEIAKSQGIKIGEADIEEGMKELAEQTGKNLAKVRAEHADAHKREMLIGMILENKVLDLIESKAKIEEA